MTKKKAGKILELLEKAYPYAKIILKYTNNFELLVSVILSAQSTDIQVNKITAKIFPKYRKKNVRFQAFYEKFSGIGASKNEIIEIVNFAFTDVSLLEKDIKSIGLYKGKARNIKSASLMLLENFNGQIPNTMESLIKLPGVGRKTANVVLGIAYGVTEGIAVDTHVKRLSLKYELTKEKSPEKIEKDLMKLFDKKDWQKVTYLLIEHGRATRKSKKDFILRKN